MDTRRLLTLSGIIAGIFALAFFIFYAGVYSGTVRALRLTQDGTNETVWKSDGAIMLLVPAGQTVADTGKKRVKKQTADFLLDKQEVTNARYAAFLNAVGYEKGRELMPMSGIELAGKTKTFVSQEGKDELPVTGVSWLGAAAYCRFHAKRLPTALEHQKACSPDYVPHVFRLGRLGFTFNPLKYRDRSGYLHKAGFMRDNRLGVYDIAANAAEWTQDVYAADFGLSGAYPESALNTRTLAGGSFSAGPSCFLRRGFAVGDTPQDAGFRCAADLERWP